MERVSDLRPEVSPVLKAMCLLALRLSGHAFRTPVTKGLLLSGFQDNGLCGDLKTHSI